MTWDLVVLWHGVFCVPCRTCMVCSKRVLAYLIDDHQVHQGTHIHIRTNIIIYIIYRYIYICI